MDDPLHAAQGYGYRGGLLIAALLLGFFGAGLTLIQLAFFPYTAVDSVLETGNYLFGEILNQFAVFVGFPAVVMGLFCLVTSSLRWRSAWVVVMLTGGAWLFSLGVSYLNRQP